MQPLELERAGESHTPLGMPRRYSADLLAWGKSGGMTLWRVLMPSLMSSHITSLKFCPAGLQSGLLVPACTGVNSDPKYVQDTETYLSDVNHDQEDGHESDEHAS